MLALIFGGLALSAVLVCLALPMRRWWKTADKLAAIVMVAAGLGPVPLVASLAGLITDKTTNIVIGIIALCLLLLVGGFYYADAKDGRVDKPLRGLPLLSLATVVLMTGSAVFPFLGDLARQGYDTVVQQVK
ncbi:hypothetical protein ACWEN6_14075 [Sphaerisporangium sp. NPDC004334]